MEQSKPHKWRFRMAKRIGRSALVVLLMMLFLEASLRALVHVQVPNPQYVQDDVTGFRLAPGVYGLASGFNSNVPDSLSRDGLRILFVGDSFTFGTYPAIDVFPEQISTLLVEKGLPNSAFNRSVPGAGTSNYVDLAREFIAIVEPDVVVVTFYLGNDVLQSHPRQETRLVFGAPATVNRSLAFGLHADDILVIKSARILSGLVARAFDEPTKPLPEMYSETGRVGGAMSKGAFLRNYRNELRGLQARPTGFITESEEGLVARMRVIRSMMPKRIVIPVLAPSRLHVDPDLQDEVLTHFDLEKGDFCFNCQTNRLAVALKAAGFSTIDLTPEFEAEQVERNLYNRRDTHWNRSGNALAARVISERIRDLLQ